jgi:hypothetical protein
METGDPVEGHRLACRIRPALIVMDALISFGAPLNLYQELKLDPHLENIAVIMLADVPRKTFFHYRIIKGGAPKSAPPEPEAFLEKPPEAEELLHWVETLMGRQALDGDERHRNSETERISDGSAPSRE